MKPEESPYPREKAPEKPEPNGWAVLAWALYLLVLIAGLTMFVPIVIIILMGGS